MKRILTWCVIIVLVVIGLAYLAHRVPGYILLQMADASVAIPLWLAVISLAIIIGIVWLLWRIIRWVMHLPAHYSAYRQKQKWQKQQGLLQEGLTHWLIGDWKATETAFKKLGSTGFMPKLSWLMVAKSASQLHNTKTTNDFINRSRFEKTKPEIAAWMFDLIRVDTLTQQNQLEEAKALLAELDKAQPKDPLVAKRLLPLQLQQGNWEHAHRSVELLYKHQLLTEAQYQHKSQQITVGQLAAAAKTSVDVLKAVWRDLPKKLQQNPTAMQHYAKGLATSDSKTAASLLHKTLKHDWNEDLFVLYCQLDHADKQQALNDAEAQFKAHEATAKTLFAMGLLCQQQQIIGRAQHYFERSLAIEANNRVSKALANLLADDGKTAEAIKVFQSI